MLFDNAVINLDSEPGDAGIAIRYAGDFGDINMFARDIAGRQYFGPEAALAPSGRRAMS